MKRTKSIPTSLSSRYSKSRKSFNTVKGNLEYAYTSENELVGSVLRPGEIDRSARSRDRQRRDETGIDRVLSLRIVTLYACRLHHSTSLDLPSSSSDNSSRSGSLSSDGSFLGHDPGPHPVPMFLHISLFLSRSQRRCVIIWVI